MAEFAGPACRHCGRPLNVGGGRPNRSGVCWGCSRRPRCRTCDRETEDGRSPCGECKRHLRACWDAFRSMGGWRQVELPAEEKERRLSLYGERAAAGLDLFTGEGSEG